jgi:hypothetical protein
MSSINPEMLKQLLSEFEEKEAVCLEEINAITEQITELEKRIVSSKERLGSVAKDREKIGAMKQRYAEGDWSSVLARIPQNGSHASDHQNDASKTGDFPPVTPQMVMESQPAAPAPAAPAPPEPAPQAAPVEPEPIPAPPPVVAPTPAPAPEMPAPQMAPPQNVPNPFEAPAAMQPQQPSQQGFPMEAPAWEQPQPFAEATPPPAPQAQEMAPAPQAPPSGGLFPFSGQPQPDSADGADIPWAPPPSMTWESVGNHTFPGQGGTPDPTQGFTAPQQQQQQQQPMPQGAPFGEQAPFGQPQQSPFGAPSGMDLSQGQMGGFGDPSGMPQQNPPQGFMSPPPGPPPGNQQSVLSSAFDEEFDISDALRGEDDNNQDPRDNDKKIKDALRGLFS